MVFVDDKVGLKTPRFIKYVVFMFTSMLLALLLPHALIRSNTGGELIHTPIVVSNTVNEDKVFLNVTNTHSRRVCLSNLSCRGRRILELNTCVEPGESVVVELSGDAGRNCSVAKLTYRIDGKTRYTFIYIPLTVSKRSVKSVETPTQTVRFGN